MYLSSKVDKDAEFNVRAEGENGKTASEYKQLDCCGTRVVK